mmetsp:Transcript_47198/g.109150  ORF Transcript_47198/g.109150 Transcript_47198/m.109150 type:complete len:248 (+) Transcript_47198:346-1089(+)
MGTTWSRIYRSKLPSLQKVPPCVRTISSAVSCRRALASSSSLAKSCFAIPVTDPLCGTASSAELSTLSTAPNRPERMCCSLRKKSAKRFDISVSVLLAPRRTSSAMWCSVRQTNAGASLARASNPVATAWTKSLCRKSCSTSATILESISSIGPAGARPIILLKRVPFLPKEVLSRLTYFCSSCTSLSSRSCSTWNCLSSVLKPLAKLFSALSTSLIVSREAASSMTSSPISRCDTNSRCMSTDPSW